MKLYIYKKGNGKRKVSRYPSKKDLRSSPPRKKKCNGTWTSTTISAQTGSLLSAAISPTANISLQLPGPQNERRFHFMSVISRPVCYLCGDKCLTDWGCR